MSRPFPFLLALTLLSSAPLVSVAQNKTPRTTPVAPHRTVTARPRKSHVVAVAPATTGPKVESPVHKPMREQPPPEHKPLPPDPPPDMKR